MYRWFLGYWRTVVFVAASTALIYVSVVVAVRLGERRTLTEMTAYDFVVAIAVGSIIGRTATTPEPSYLQGLTVVVALVGCHHLMSVPLLRAGVARRITDRPAIELVRDGLVLPDGLPRARMTEGDLDMVLRERGVPSRREAALVMLECRGAFSVVRDDTDHRPEEQT
jgi:uncharacterized membrane protein YcaP (DUF421 family)